MSKKLSIILPLIGVCAAIALIVATRMHLDGRIVAVFQPHGIVAEKERNLILWSFGLMMIVVLPVLAMTGFIAWKYRATNPTVTYMPEWDSNKKLEAVWWGVPMLLIVVLAIITWRSSHDLDPFKPLESDKKPLVVQVVALDWKWLFIYPEQDIATVNYFRMPVDTPVNFEITADAPMNSFWIPQLGGQIYAMGGMSTRLHLMADTPGQYRGVSANISGKGFAGMKFIAEATNKNDFDAWVSTVKAAPNTLDAAAYEVLASPTENNPVAYFSSKAPGLYDTIVMKDMEPHTGSGGITAVDVHSQMGGH